MKAKSAPPTTDIKEGDLLVALLDGVRSPSGFPVVVPKKGQLYRCTGVYPEWYGFGCTLEGLNHKPYKGFFLLSHGIWYFKKVVTQEQPASISFQELLRQGVGVGTPIREDERELEDA
jgi:hypothetical protein